MPTKAQMDALSQAAQAPAMMNFLLSGGKPFTYLPVRRDMTSMGVFPVAPGPGMSWAVPQALTDIGNDLLEAGDYAYDVGSGQRSLETDDYVSHITPALMDVAVGGIGASRVVGPKGNVHGAFVGSRSRNYLPMELEEAEWAAERGHSRESIHDQTGWFKGADGEWRREINDVGSVMAGRVGEMQAEGTSLGDILPHHPRLYEAHPGLRDIHVKHMPLMDSIGGTLGMYSPDKDTIWLARQANLANEKSTLHHEIQHAIQEREGFAQGGTPEAFLTKSGRTLISDFRKRYDKYIQSLADKYGVSSWRVTGVVDHARNNYRYPLSAEEAELKSRMELTGDMKTAITTRLEREKADAINDGAFELYRSLMGETEAHNVQGRLEYPEEAARTYPWNPMEHKAYQKPIPERHQILKPYTYFQFSTEQPEPFIPARPIE